MRYNGNDALGFIETVGMVPAIEGADKMLKAANVQLTAYENIGSTLVTIMIKGDVAAVRASVTAGADAAGKIGKLTAQNVIPRPIREVDEITSIYEVETEEVSGQRPGALGLVETFGIVYALQAADAMCKAANVTLSGFENVASGYISILVTGDVGACKQAVEAGVKAVEAMGTEVYSSTVIASPHRNLEQILKRYSMELLLPKEE